MEFIRYLFSTIIDIASMNLNVLGYSVSILEIAVFVMLGSILITVVLGK